MRPRRRSRGDGPDACTQRAAALAEGGGSQASCLARNARQRRGRRLAKPLQVKNGKSPDQPQERPLGALTTSFLEKTAPAGLLPACPALPACSHPKPRSEPVHDPRRCAYQPHIRSPSMRLHHNPACGGKGPGDDTILDDGVLAMPRCGRPPGFRRADQARTELLFSCQARMAAPSITTPALTYFHKATTSFRAKAVIITFFKRPPFWATRSLNQRLRSDPGW